MGAGGLDWLVLLRVVPLLAVFAIFFSSVLVALCSFAKSFKEAQAYLIPIMLLSLGPGIISLMPNVKLTAALAVLPQVNLILLARDTLSRTAVPVSLVAIVILTTLFYTLAALVFAAKGFGDQGAATADDFRWSDLLKRPQRVSETPELGHLATYLSLFFPLYFFATSWIGLQATEDLKANAIMNAMALLVLFLLLPLIYSTFVRLRLKSTFRLTIGPMPWTAFIVSIAFALTLWMFAFEILRFTEILGIRTLSEEVLERTRHLRERL